MKTSDLARLEKLQYQAAKICTGALHLTSKDKLNDELAWTSIKTRIDLLGLCLFQKIHNCESRPLIVSCMTRYNMNSNTRQFGRYPHHPMYGVAFQKSFFPYFTKKWNELPISIRGLPIYEFKMYLIY